MWSTGCGFVEGTNFNLHPEIKDSYNFGNLNTQRYNDIHEILKKSRHKGQELLSLERAEVSLMHCRCLMGIPIHNTDNLAALQRDA